MWIVEGTLYSEEGLCFNACVGIIHHAGIDAGILLCEIGDLETSSSQQLHTAVTRGKTEYYLDLTDQSFIQLQYYQHLGLCCM